MFMMIAQFFSYVIRAMQREWAIIYLEYLRKHCNERRKWNYKLNWNQGVYDNYINHYSWDPGTGNTELGKFGLGACLVISFNSGDVDSIPVNLNK